MFESHLLRQVKEGERLIRIVRRYWVTMILPVTLSALCIIAPFFFLVPMFRLGTPGVAGFFSLIIVGVFFALRTTFVYSLNAFVITDRRIIDIDQHGLFNRAVSECSFATVQDVSIRVKGVFQTFFHYGSVLIQTAGTTANLELDGVKHPENVQEVISRLVEDSHQEKDGSNLSAQDLLHLAEKMKEGLTPDQFRKILGQKTKE